jgi:hypothetical protein
MSQTYDNTGTTALWRNEKYEPGGKAPRLKGHVYAHRDIKAGDKFAIALWDSNSENDKAPALRGKVEDIRKPDAQSASAPASIPDPAPVTSDEIPF